MGQFGEGGDHHGTGSTDSSALPQRGLRPAGTPIATPPTLPLAEALTLAAEALRKIERGDGERSLAAEILEAHRDGRPLPQGMPLKHAAIHGSYALSVAQEQPSADCERLQEGRDAIYCVSTLSRLF